jgi:hypothetical protein
MRPVGSHARSTSDQRRPEYKIKSHQRSSHAICIIFHVCTSYPQRLLVLPVCIKPSSVFRSCWSGEGAAALAGCSIRDETLLE